MHQRVANFVASSMSFYDTIKIDFTQLPLSEADILRLKVNKADFQTESLEGMYGVYKITTNGYLEKADVRMVDAHGIVEVYTKVDDKWFFFKARFREGQVTHLFRLRKLPQTHSRTCTWELEIPIDELKPAYDTEAIQHELSLLNAHERQHLKDEFADFNVRN